MSTINRFLIVLLLVLVLGGDGVSGDLGHPAADGPRRARSAGRHVSALIEREPTFSPAHGVPARRGRGRRVGSRGYGAVRHRTTGSDPAVPRAGRATRRRTRPGAGAAPIAGTEWAAGAAAGRAGGSGRAAGRFVVEGLAPPGVDAIGLSGPARAASAARSGRAAIRSWWALLADLPVVTQLPPLRRLTQRLLVTGAPVGGREAGHLLAPASSGCSPWAIWIRPGAARSLPPTDCGFGARAQGGRGRLAAGRRCGRLPAARTPSAPTGARVLGGDRHLLPPRRGRSRRRPARARPHARSRPDRGWRVLRAGDGNGRSDGAPPAPADRAELTPIHLALLALRQVAVAARRPRARQAAGADRRGARSRPWPARSRLVALERAFLVGAARPSGWPRPMPSGRRRRRRSAVGCERTGMPEPGRSPTPPYAQQASRRRAPRCWMPPGRAARGDERFLVADGVRAAVHRAAGRASARGRRTERGARAARGRAAGAGGGWLSLLSAQAGTDPDDAVAGAGRRCSPWPESAAAMRCPASTARRSRPGGDVTDADSHGRASVRAARRRRRAGRRRRVAGACWRRRYQRPASVPASALWRGLERAAAERRVGETVLFALHMLNGRPEAAHPEVLTACLRALRRVGLDRDARAIAVATALIE